MLKLVKGKQLIQDIKPKKSDFQWREDIGRHYLNMKLAETKTLAIFYTNFVLLLGCIALTILVNAGFIFGVFIAVISSYISHENYLEVWSKRNKFGRKTMIRIDMEKRPAVIANGPKVPWINIKEE